MDSGIECCIDVAWRWYGVERYVVLTWMWHGVEKYVVLTWRRYGVERCAVLKWRRYGVGWCGSVMYMVRCSREREYGMKSCGVGLCDIGIKVV